MKEPVIVAEYDPRWPVMFEEEKTRLLGVIGHVVEQVHRRRTEVEGHDFFAEAEPADRDIAVDFGRLAGRERHEAIARGDGERTRCAWRTDREAANCAGMSEVAEVRCGAGRAA